MLLHIKCSLSKNTLGVKYLKATRDDSLVSIVPNQLTCSLCFFAVELPPTLQQHNNVNLQTQAIHAQINAKCAHIIRVEQVKRAICKLVLSNVYFSSSGSCDLWLIAIMCNLFMNMLELQEGFPYPTVFTIESGRHLQMQIWWL